MKKLFTLERVLLLGLSAGAFIGIWYALPMLNAVADEQYYVGGVLRALEAKSFFPLPGDVPYGTVTFYLNYLLQLPLLFVLLVWEGLHVSALKVFLILHPEISYLVPRFASAAIAAMTLWAYNRFLRAENAPLLQRFAVLAALFCTVLPAVIFHTGKMWVLSIALVFASFVYAYRALKLFKDEPYESARSARWSAFASLLAFANLPLAGVFLFNIPLLVYAFRGDKIRLRILVRGVAAGAAAIATVAIINFQNIYYQVGDIFTRYHPLLSGGNALSVKLSPLASLLLHAEQVVMAFPTVLVLLLFAFCVGAIKNKLLFWLSTGYATLYFVTIVLLVTWLTSIGDSLRHLFPFAFFFSGMLAALDYKKMRTVFLIFCTIQVSLYIYVLYLLSVPTTFNLADDYLVEHYAQQQVLVYNNVAEITLPLNTQSSILLSDEFCGSKCQYMRSASTTLDFLPVVVTFQSQLQNINKNEFSDILWLNGQTLTDTCAGEPVTSFQSGASDANYVGVEHNFGNYLLPDFWHLSRAGRNVYIYEISPQCFSMLLST